MLKLAIFLGVVALQGTALLLRARRRRRGLPYPPGPPASLILGNVRDLPKENEAAAYASWRDLYGPVVHLRVLNRHIVVLNTLKAADDLLNKRSAIYSSRPRSPMFELSGWSWSSVIMPYGPRWRQHRKRMQSFLDEHMTARYHDRLISSNAIFLRSLLQSPHKFRDHIHRSAGANILSLTYGIDVALENDPWIELVDKAVDALTRAGIPGSYAIDWLPFLKYVPAWFPGAAFKRQALEWRGYSTRMVEAPFQWVKDQLASEKPPPPSFVTEMIGLNVDAEDIMKNMAGVIYLGGADTTVSTIAAFFLAMTINPEIQYVAQEEIDRVVGPGRLPDFSDRPSMPYVEAIVRELFRFYPVVPLCVPHQVTSDDEYEGMFIPAETTVIPNIWAILRDEAEYPNASCFWPERFLKGGMLNPDVRLPSAVYGFGRRVCPGRHLADASVWLAVATVLASFTIARPKDHMGNDIVPSGEMTSGAVSSPAPFACVITPRSATAQETILQTVDSTR